MTTVASGSQHDLRYITEVTPGTTPSTPSMKKLRNTGCTLEANATASVSKEIRPDGMIPDVSFSAEKVSGGIPFLLSYGEYDSFLESALRGTWGTNVLKAARTAKSFTIERAMTDVGVYRVFRGCEVDKLSLSFKADATDLPGTFSLVGMSNSDGTSSLDASPDASIDNDVFDAFTGEVIEGEDEEGVILLSLDLEINNGLKDRRRLMQRGAFGIAAGRSNVTGTLEAYLTDKTLLDKYRNRTESSISVTVGDGLAKSYTFDLPRIKYTSVETVLESENDIIVRCAFQALVDSVSGTNLQITRIPGA